MPDLVIILDKDPPESDKMMLLAVVSNVAVASWWFCKSLLTALESCTQINNHALWQCVRSFGILYYYVIPGTTSEYVLTTNDAWGCMCHKIHNLYSDQLGNW